MRLIKKVTFNRIKELPQFKKLENSFTKQRNKSNNSPINNIKDISRLSFYFILEYINIIRDKINYKKIFIDNKESNYTEVDFNILMEEQDKLKKYIKDKNKNTPEYFKKLGILNEVVGCFIVGTIKKNIKSIEKLDMGNKDNSVFIKLDIKNLPKEFEQICIDFSKTKHNCIEQEHEEFEKFMKLSNDEQDNIIEDILHNIQYPSIVFLDFAEEGEDTFINNFDLSGPLTATTIEHAAENSIDNIKDINFLNSMLTSALETENYELCIKIRDRLFFLQKS